MKEPSKIYFHNGSFFYNLGIVVASNSIPVHSIMLLPLILCVISKTSSVYADEKVRVPSSNAEMFHLLYSRESLRVLVVKVGVEPTTSCVSGKCSNQLNYFTILVLVFPSSQGIFQYLIIMLDISMRYLCSYPSRRLIVPLSLFTVHLFCTKQICTISPTNFIFMSS